MLAGIGIKDISPEYAQTLKYFSQYLNLESPLLNWVLFEVGGLLIGAFTVSLLSGNFKFKFDKASGMKTQTRLITALGGGILIGFASRLARGCTSGVALSGGKE